MHRRARAALKRRRFVPLVLDAPLQLGIPGLQQLDGVAVLRQQGVEGGLRRPAGEADAQFVGLRGQGESLASAKVAVVDPLVDHARGGEVRGHLQVVDDEVDEGPERVPALDGSRVSERAEEALAEVGELSERFRHAVPIFRLRRLVDRALAAGQVIAQARGGGRAEPVHRGPVAREEGLEERRGAARLACDAPVLKAPRNEAVRPRGGRQREPLS